MAGTSRENFIKSPTFSTTLAALKITLNSTIPAFLKAHLARACNRLLEILFPDFLQAQRHVQRCCSNFSEIILVCLQVDSFGEVFDSDSSVGISEGSAHDPDVVVLEVTAGSLSDVGSDFVSCFNDCLMLLSELSINFTKRMIS